MSAAATPLRSRRLGDLAPISAVCTTKGEVRLDQYRGRSLLYLSYPADFMPACTSEFLAPAHAAPAFEVVDCALLGLSLDSRYSYTARMRAIRELAGIEVPSPAVDVEERVRTLFAAFGAAQPFDKARPTAARSAAAAHLTGAAAFARIGSRSVAWI